LRAAVPGLEDITDTSGRRYVAGIALTDEGLQLWELHNIGPQLKSGSKGVSTTKMEVNKAHAGGGKCCGGAILNSTSPLHSTFEVMLPPIRQAGLRAAKCCQHFEQHVAGAKCCPISHCHFDRLFFPQHVGGFSSNLMIKWEWVHTVRYMQGISCAREVLFGEGQP
jgi:hypothetical protein